MSGTESNRALPPAGAVLTSSLMLWNLVLSPSCNRLTTPEDEGIGGSYAATKFTEPGQLDGGVDILAKGGRLTAQLTSDFKAEGHLRIPDDIGSNFAPVDTNYAGEYTLDGDSLRFKNTRTFLDYHPWVFIVKGAWLETPDWTGRWGGTKIVLHKR